MAFPELVEAQMTAVQRRVILVCIAAIAAAACATTEKKPLATDQSAQWAANGWLSAGKEGDPEIIGLYLSREECDAAIAGWMSRQVAGNPVHGECLPIDRR